MQLITTSCFKFHSNYSPARSGLLIIGLCPFLAICCLADSIPILIIHVLYQENTSSQGEIQSLIKSVAGLPGIQEGCVPIRGFSFPPHPSACQANEASPLITLEGKDWSLCSPKTQSHHFSSKQVVLAIFFESHSLYCTFNLWLWRCSIHQEMPPSRTALE